jgi:ParB family chromosome partitioning protein
MTSKQVLGKGFDGLIPTGFNIDTVATPGEQIRQLSLDKLVANPDQPRKSFDEKAINELSESIKQHGIIQPLVVTPTDDGYRIVAGERRFRAAKKAGLSKVPVIIRNHKELEEIEIALVENVQRVDLSPLETAVSIVRLRDQFSLTPKQIAAKLGKAETTISNIIRLLNLPQEAVKALQENRITEGHARAILSLRTDENKQKELLNKIITQNISVREAEEFVKQSRTQNTQEVIIDDETSKKLQAVSKKLSLKTTVKKKSKGGVLQLEFKDDDQLNVLLHKLSSQI